MNYGEVKEQIKNLAFEEDEQMEEYKNIVIDSINRAITMIAQDVSPIRKYLEIEQDGTSEEYQYYVLPELTGGMFMEFDDVLIQVDDGTKYVPFTDYEIQTGDTLVLSGKASGKFRVFYKSAHEMYVGADDTVELPLPKKSHHLVPLLASYYVWNDDDQQKAIMYYNQFESSAQTIVAREQMPRVRVRTEWNLGGAKWL